MTTIDLIGLLFLLCVLLIAVYALKHTDPPSED